LKIGVGYDNICVDNKINMKVVKWRHQEAWWWILPYTVYTRDSRV